MKTIILMMLIAIGANAHPGIGIVEDSKGNIFYTDLKQVWKITRQGTLSVVVKNVHTHELFMDENDNLFGEHLWYNEGNKEDPWHHFVWKFDSKGQFSKIIPDTPGFLEDYSFVRDHFGRMYWVERTNECQKIVRKNIDNSRTILGDQCMKNIRWIRSNDSGVIYLSDFQDLKRVDTNGNVRLISSRIADKNIAQSTVDNQHSVMGIWDDSHGNIYTAVMAHKVVKKFMSDGREQIIYKTQNDWSPTGGLIDSHNNLWVLECNSKNEVRVEKITPDRLLKIE